MTKETILKLAVEAGFNPEFDDYVYEHADRFVRFAKLVASAEREACAQIAFNAKTYIQAATAIRARGQQ